MSHHPIIIERTFRATIDKVWQAITEKDQMKVWYFDLTAFKAEVGFKFQFSGGTEEKSYLHLCEITVVEPPKKLQYSWKYDGYEGISYVTFELFEEGPNTRLKLTHEGLETFPDQPDFARKNFNAGWTEIIGSLLKQYVEKDKQEKDTR